MQARPTASGAQLLLSKDVHAMLPKQNVVQLGLVGLQTRLAQRCWLQLS
jgi:hypothetical protein